MENKKYEPNSCGRFWPWGVGSIGIQEWENFRALEAAHNEVSHSDRQTSANIVILVTGSAG